MVEADGFNPDEVELTDPKALLPTDRQGVRKAVRRLRSFILRPLSQGSVDRLIDGIGDQALEEMFDRGGMRKSTRVIHRHDRTWNNRFEAMQSLGLTGRPFRPLREINGQEYTDGDDSNPFWKKGPDADWAALATINQDLSYPEVSDRARMVRR